MASKNAIVIKTPNECFHKEKVVDLEVEISDLKFSSATYYLCNLVLLTLSKPVSLAIKQ